jgi:hypothetical protein
MNNSGTQTMGASGTNTAALSFGGVQVPPPSGLIIASTQSWNGTNWTNENDLNTARDQLDGTGSQTAALAIGGNPVTTATEEWNGTGQITRTITSTTE